MASIVLRLFLLFSAFHSSLSVLLPVSKHALTSQYLTRIRLGSQPEPLSLLVDLSSPSLWVVDCASHTLIASLSIPCSAAADRSHPLPPPSGACTVSSLNPVSKLAARGELVSDSVSLRFLSEPSQTQIGVVDEFLFICAPRFLSQGLAGGAKGVFGLGRSSRISPISQFAHQLDLPGKFSICLPGNNKGDGFILAGKSPDNVAEISRSLLYTPLLDKEIGPGAGPGSGSVDEYYIQVKSIMIGNKKLSLPGPTIRAKLSTVDPLTKLGPGAYETFLKAFSIAADAANLTRVDAVKPFGLCYGAGEATGGVPAIDLVLQSEMVKWRITGRNSMVEAGDGVVCLGVLDGGVDLGEDEMVIGAHQLEDVLMEFDLRSGMLGFSSSLPDKGTSCGELGFAAAARRREF